MESHDAQEFESQLTRLLYRMSDHAHWRRVVLEGPSPCNQTELTERLKISMERARIVGTLLDPTALAQAFCAEHRVILLEAPLAACRRLRHELEAQEIPAFIEECEDP